MKGDGAVLIFRWLLRVSMITKSVTVITPQSKYNQVNNNNVTKTDTQLHINKSRIFFSLSYNAVNIAIKENNSH